MTEPTHDISVEGFIESFDRRYPTFILKTLLCDRTTGRNIIWADNEYEALGDGYMGDDEITVEKITGMNSGIIKPRIAKEQKKQSQRTKSRAEVFTPSWLCNQMNNDLDEAWFGRRGVFNTEIAADGGANTWTPTSDPIVFPKSKGYGWRAYVEAPRLEITCGEAPFVCSRYDTVTGDELSVGERVGFLDRKLRVVTEKTKTRKEWVRRALDALRATYGFEYQGDNLLIARINVLETFAEHLRDRWGSDPEQDELEQAAWIVSWNFWQMNGFTDAVPTNKMGAEVESTLGTFEEPEPEPMQPSLFDLFDDMFTGETTEETKEEEPRETVPLCVIYNWQNGEPFEFATLKGKAANMGKKFYAVIGNPPYQESVEGSSRSKPIYNLFMDASYGIAEKSELITPARFLFDSGLTPKSFNRKMLEDVHLRICKYYSDGAEVFPNTDIKGGVVITYHDEEKTFDPIRRMYKDERHRPLVEKAINAKGFRPLSDIIGSQGTFKYTDTFFVDNPAARKVLCKGTKDKILSAHFSDSDFASSFLDRESTGCIKMLARVGGQRVYRWIRDDYVVENGNDTLDYYKVFVAEAQGSGAYGETLSDTVIGEPGTAQTDTFLTFGKFDNVNEANNLSKYLKTKYARALLGALKVTQHAASAVWAYVPLQDFTSASDIDWSQSVAGIDRQLYEKYGLDDEEIEFIESHVKEMN